MITRKHWSEMAHHYRWMLVYIAAVVTVGLVLQIIQASKGTQ